MPLPINVDLSSKSSHRYHSIGVSINVTAKLDPALLACAAQFQQQIANLYEQARATLNRWPVIRISRSPKSLKPTSAPLLSPPPIPEAMVHP